MNLETFTQLHVAISLLAIASGLFVLFGLITNKRLDAGTVVFLATTVLTSVTGFGFPITGPTPGLILGVLSLILLTLAIYARYARRLAGIWTKVYVITAVLSLYFNVLVLIVQSFQKVPALQALAPTQSEPPFIATQLITMLAFIILGTLAVKRFHPTFHA